MSPLFLTLAFLDGMFHLARHERIGILLEDAQAGARAEIDSFSSIQGAGIIRGIFEFASAGRFEFGWWGGGSFSQNNFSL